MAKWEELPIADRSEYMRIAVKNGYRDIRSIREAYNEYARGGKKKQKEDDPINGGTLQEVVVTGYRNPKITMKGDLELPTDVMRNEIFRQSAVPLITPKKVDVSINPVIQGVFDDINRQQQYKDIAKEVVDKEREDGNWYYPSPLSTTDYDTRLMELREDLSSSPRLFGDGGGTYLPEVTVLANPQPYNRFLRTLPSNLRNTDESEYRMHRYWELNGRPRNFSEAVRNGMFSKQPDGYYHARSVAEDPETGSYEFMKYPNHPTINKELEWYNSKEGKQFRDEYKIDKESEPYYQYKKRFDGGGDTNSRDKSVKRATYVASNYDDAKDFDMNPIVYAARKAAKDLTDRGGLSNCTLSATQWVDPSNPYMSARNIFNNPESGYTEVSRDDALPGDLLISKNPEHGSYHTMLIEGFDKNNEPILRYSRGGHDTEENLVKGRTLKGYHAADNLQGGNHTEDHYFRYNYPNEYWLPEVTVTAPRRR